MSNIAVYPGTFDPITNGHTDLVARASRLCDKVIVAVAEHTAKNTVCDTAQRVELARIALADCDNVEVVAFEGLLVDFCTNAGANLVIRGLRAVSDFEYELQMGLMNRQLCDELETIFLMPRQESIFLSSRTIKAVADVDGALNTDLHPVSYYLSMVLWNRQFSGVPGLLPGARRVLDANGVAIAGVALALALALPLLRRNGRSGARRRTVFASVVVVGATEIALELTALLAFQSIYGYVYHQVALIVAAFMAGLALGGRAGTAAVRRGAGGRTFVLMQLLITCVPLSLAAALARIAALPAGALASWASYFPLIVVATAFLAGAQFPVAVRLVAGKDAGASGGRVYGADLLGAAVGAVATSVLLLPIAGVAGAMRAWTLLNVAVLVALALAFLPNGKPGTR